MNTPFILSPYQYRGFLIRFNPVTGGIWVFSEGSDLPLLHLIDPDPLQIEYIGFATWHNRVIQVAFNCRAKDENNDVPPSTTVSGKTERNNGSRKGMMRLNSNFIST
jgi:hypothetical protein